MNHTRSPSFRRSPIQKPPESDSIKHKDKSSRQSFINHHGSIKVTDPTSTKLLFDPIDPRKLSSAHLTGLANGFLPTPNITKYRNIGKCGLKLPSYGIAVWSNMSSKLTDEQSESIIKTAYENGFHYFDTGDAFNNGKSEQLLGNIIKKFNWERSSFIVSTKLFWNHPVIEQNKNIGLSRKYIIEAVKSSLKRLKLEYIDLVIINRLDGFCPCEEIVRTMNILINNNLILYWGTSRWNYVHIAEAFGIARQFNCFPPIVEQMEYSPTKNREKFYHLLELYHKIGIGVISWSGNLLGADPGISLISRKSLEEYQNLFVAEESYLALSAAAQQEEKDRIEEQIITIPIKEKEKIKETDNAESGTGKLSVSLKKLSKKLSTPEKKKAEKNLSVNSAKTADCLSIDQTSIDKRSSISIADQAARLADLDVIINKLNINRSQFDAVYALRNEPVCSALIQPNSVKELNLYIDALKLEISVNTLRDIDKISSKFCKLPNIAPDTVTVVEDEQL